MKMSKRGLSPSEESSQGTQLESKRYPDYCRTISFTDNHGVLRELVFPKALDLDRPKRARTTFSRGQLERLESEFTANQYLVGRERSQLARTLGLSETQVKVWFQNRRTKHKRDKEKQAESEEAHAESLATQSLLQILQPAHKASPLRCPLSAVPDTHLNHVPETTGQDFPEPNRHESGFGIPLHLESRPNHPPNQVLLTTRFADSLRTSRDVVPDPGTFLQSPVFPFSSQPPPVPCALHPMVAYKRCTAVDVDQHPPVDSEVSGAAGSRGRGFTNNETWLTDSVTRRHPQHSGAWGLPLPAVWSGCAVMPYTLPFQRAAGLESANTC